MAPVIIRRKSLGMHPIEGATIAAVVLLPLGVIAALVVYNSLK